MQTLLRLESGSGRSDAFWKNPAVWLRRQKLSRGYWVFFTAAFFFDAGFSIYAFLFNLYLLDYHFNERAIGLIGGAATLGSVVATLPAGMLAKRRSIRPLLIFCFVTASVLNGWRVLWMWEPAQIGLAFLSGVAMSLWGVCFLPAVARLTTKDNRTSAFSLIFSVSIGSSILGGIISGYLPRWLRAAGFSIAPSEVRRLILLAACVVVLIGLTAVVRLRVPLQSPEEVAANALPARANWLRRLAMVPFLLRFFPLMALWSAVLAAFNPFANAYLAHGLHMSMEHIGLIFSVTQVVQLFMGVVTPVAFRVLGLIKGILVTQLVAAITIACLAGARNEALAIALYIGFSAAQWISAPGLYNLLMNETPDTERSTSAAMTLFCNALAASAATAGAGILFTRFGYPPVLLGIAAVAVMAALLFRIVVAPRVRAAAQP